MTTANEKVAASLEELHRLQNQGRRVIKSAELGRTHRTRLVQAGFLQQIIKGWWLSTVPSAAPGDTTPWYSVFWEFCGRYCNDRFGDEWHLSPEQSVLIWSEATTVPSQVIVYTPKGTNNVVDLPFRTSIYDLRQKESAEPGRVVAHGGLRVLTPAAAITGVSEAFLTRNPMAARIVLSGIRDASEVLSHLLQGGHTIVAGRIAGALRGMGRPEIADEISSALRAANHMVREVDPFAGAPPVSVAMRAAPIAARISALWGSMRSAILDVFPREPGVPADPGLYLRHVEEIYRSDAYHSLSIEGYQVTPQLIERVRAGNWNPEHDAGDRAGQDALAARGYWQAFQAVKGTVGEILRGGEAGKLARYAHGAWYREMFQPCVSAGLISAAALAGYRAQPVYLRGSRHVPPRAGAVLDAMPALFGLIENEESAAVRAVLGHWMIGYIHPYPDGNGRVARFLMNAMLASGGYPWTVIRVDDRARYLDALESASVDHDIEPFARFVGERVERAMNGVG